MRKKWQRFLSGMMAFVLAFTMMLTGIPGFGYSALEQVKAADETYTLTVTPGAVTVEAGDTITLRATIKDSNGNAVTDLETASLQLWWWTDTWADGHEDGKTDAEYSNYDENSGYSLTADVTFPSTGTYYIAAKLGDITEFVTVQVNEKSTAPTGYSVRVIQSKSSVVAGNELTLNAIVTDDTGAEVTDLEQAGLHLYWSENNATPADGGCGSNGYNLSATFSWDTPGSYWPTVKLQDSNWDTKATVWPEVTVEAEKSATPTYNLSVKASKKSYIQPNETVKLTASFSASDDSEITLGGDYHLYWWFDENRGLGVGTYITEDRDEQTSIEVSLPEKGDYYVIASLQDSDYKELKQYVIKLSSNDIENIYVEQIELDDDFIKGVDISSLEAELASGVKYHDFEGNELDEAGFFAFLKENGVNWVRIRVWNDPYDEEGNGYGGGNCDLAKAISMGKYATAAGLRVLIDFHYSDTWADPGRQLTPKDWEEYDFDQKIAAIESYTQQSVESLLNAGVDVGMVQIGNETSNTICDISEEKDGFEKMCKAFSAGAAGVRAAAGTKDIKVAIHIESPQAEGKYAKYAKGLDDNEVDYDVFASSYYPMWHGSLENLNAVLDDIAKTYGKEVMVAETSWSFTTDDGDGWGNEVGPDSGYDNYEYSVQGQANELYDVVKTVSETTNGIGVFYWEPAWIPVNYVYDDAGNWQEAAKQANVEAWGTYGSGWATKACAEYDPDNVGENGAWAGGSAVDNHAWFDFYGYPLASMKTFAYMERGNTTLQQEVWKVSAEDVSAYVGEEVQAPNATIRYNFGEDKVVSDVAWDTAAIASAVANGVGTYMISGKVTEAGVDYDVTFNLTISVYNYLDKGNPSFENGTSVCWNIDGETSQISIKAEDPKSGEKALKYEKALLDAGAHQTVYLDSGIYTLGAYMQGNNKADGETYQIYATVEGATYTADATPAGWAVWQNPVVENIVVTKDNTAVEVGCRITTTGSAWGTWDDFYLNRVGDYTGTDTPSLPSTPTAPSTPSTDDTTVTTNPDGTTTETKTETVTNEAGKEVEVTTETKKDAEGNVIGSTETSVIESIAKNTTATVTVEKNASGEVTSAQAEVTKQGTSSKTGVTGTISAAVVSQITDAAGVSSVEISVNVTNVKGEIEYTIKADAEDLEAGNKLKVMAIDPKTGKYVLVNAKTYTVSKSGNVKVTLPEGATYQLLDSKEAAAVEKEILSTVKVKKTSITVETGKKTSVQMSSKLDMDNVEKITYSTSKKSVATVSKSGKVTAKNAGTVTIKAKVTLKNGKTKTVTVKVKVK
ncbi:MAG: glycosyl hydrolase 53 family protein [Lachnospiraceae bacterium]|nr:glycosyl hydrolase 53 family protein [Lachnospiraceae bacterium]MDY5520583.1 glycosyl hydrolase 53 family protein [Agathobacter sp.]